MPVMNTKKTEEIRNVLRGMVERVVNYGWRTDEQRETAVAVLTGINHIAGMLSDGRKNEAAVAAKVDSLVELITRLAGSRHGRQQFLVDMLTGLSDLVVKAGIHGAATKAAKLRNASSVHRRGDFEVTYLVRKGRGGQERLVEHREGSRKSLSATRKDYGAAIKAITEFDEPVNFKNLWERFVAHGGGDIGSQYPLRVILRFWRSSEPSLITKNKTCYLAKSRGFTGRATKAWNKTKQTPAVQ